MSNAQFEEMTKNIEDLILSQEQIASGQYPKNEVYEVRFDDTTIGPIWQQDIKEYLQSAGHFEEGTEIKSQDQDQWVHIFEHPFFQRRKPQLVSTQVLDNEEVKYHLLIDGQKHGPFTSFEVNSMIEKQEVLVTGEVSIDDGASWGQLYEIEDFDRRVLKSNEELPALPTDNIFTNSSKEVVKKLESFSDEKTNLIAGLAYIGNLRIGKAREAKKSQDINKEEEAHHLDDQIQEESNGIGAYVWQILFAISAIGLVTIFISWSNQKPSTERTPASKKSTKAPVSKIEPIKLKPIQEPATNNNFNQRPSIDTEAKVNERPTSFRRSKAFRQAARPKKKLTDDARYPNESDDFYYDDNTQPVELDPVRSTLSKETIDPEFNNDGFIDEQEGDYSAQEFNQQDDIFNEEVEY